MCSSYVTATRRTWVRRESLSTSAFARSGYRPQHAPGSLLDCVFRLWVWAEGLQLSRHDLQFIWFIPFPLLCGWAINRINELSPQQAAGYHVGFAKKCLAAFISAASSGVFCRQYDKESYANQKLMLRLLEEKYGDALPWVVEEKQLARARELEAKITQGQSPVSHS